MKQKVVIVGFGWASLGFLNNIDYNKFNIELYSKNRIFNYTPFLAQAITNKKYDKLLTRDINSFPKISFYNNSVIDIDIDKNNITIDNQDNTEYDYLVLSHGATINYYNIKGLKEHSFILKNKNDMLTIRDKLPSNSKIAIMGCGPTGVEIIGSLLDEYICFSILPNIFIFDECTDYEL